MSGPRLLGRLDDIPDGGAKGYDLVGQGRDSMFVIRRGSQVHGWENDCPHIPGSPMAWRRNAYLNAAKDRIVCSGHGALFDIVTGVCDSGACLGQTLRKVDVVVLADRRLFIRNGEEAHDDA